MKKILSVILAIMMIFGTVAVSASATGTGTSEEVWYEGKVTSKQCTIVFDLNNGTMKSGVYVWNTDTSMFEYQSNVKGIYTMLPRYADAHTEGNYIALPSVTAPDGWDFVGWYCQEGVDAGKTLAGSTIYTIPNGSAGTVIKFIAAYEVGEVEADTMDTIMGILVKVFGAIIGVLMYGGDTAAGVQMMEKVLGGVLG